eukprot:2145049-Rhodomonas_salina.1
MLLSDPHPPSDMSRTARLTDPCRHSFKTGPADMGREDCDACTRVVLPHHRRVVHGQPCVRANCCEHRTLDSVVERRYCR